MRQGTRFLFRPGTFFNQLQFSSHHWFILLAFAVVASLETHVGRSHVYYQIFANLLVAKYQIPWSTALWIVTSVKLVVFLFGAFVLSTAVWLVGSLFGRRTSKRVLFRRLSIVFTVLMSAYTISHLTSYHPSMPLISSFLYGWGALLGFFAIREQFALTTAKSLVLSVFGWLMVLSSWHYSREAMERYARAEWAQAQIAAAHSTPPSKGPRRVY